MAAAAPIFHLGATDGWVNDPNGPLLHRGRYHLLRPGVDPWGTATYGTPTRGGSSSSSGKRASAGTTGVKEVLEAEAAPTGEALMKAGGAGSDGDGDRGSGAQGAESTAATAAALSPTTSGCGGDWSDTW
eukprot:XP_001693584.1 predicted protein [Chlamydomonas reinhardtii]